MPEVLDAMAECLKRIHVMHMIQWTAVIVVHAMAPRVRTLGINDYLTHNCEPTGFKHNLGAPVPLREHRAN